MAADLVHVFRWDKRAVSISAVPRPVGQKMRIGAWKCVMCRELLDFIKQFDLDHAGDCPGYVAVDPDLEVWVG